MFYVSDAMVRHPVTVRKDETLRDVAEHVFGDARHTACPVTDDGRAVGLLPAELLSIADVRRLLELRRAGGAEHQDHRRYA